MTYRPAVTVEVQANPIEIVVWGGPPGADGQPGPAGADGQPGADGAMVAIVQSDTPPLPDEIGTLWIRPECGAAPDAAIDYAGDPVTAQADGTPIGLSADGTQFFQPTIVAAVPVIIGGRRYLLPICEE